MDEFNRGDNFGNAYFHMNQRGGRRWGATKAFLRPALGRPNLTVITKAHTRKVVLEGADGAKRAAGIDLVVEGRGERVVVVTPNYGAAPREEVTAVVKPWPGRCAAGRRRARRAARSGP